MLTIDQIKEHLRLITYRPGWTIEAYQGSWEGIHIRIVAPKVEDSYNPGEFVDLGITSHLPPMQNFHQLETWLAWRLNRIETHEMREWLKFGGVPIFNPHSDGAEEDR